MLGKTKANKIIENILSDSYGLEVELASGVLVDPKQISFVHQRGGEGYLKITLRTMDAVEEGLPEDAPFYEDDEGAINIDVSISDLSLATLGGGILIFSEAEMPQMFLYRKQALSEDEIL